MTTLVAVHGPGSELPAHVAAVAPGLEEVGIRLAPGRDGRPDAVLVLPEGVSTVRGGRRRAPARSAPLVVDLSHRADLSTDSLSGPLRQLVAHARVTVCRSIDQALATGRSGGRLSTTHVVPTHVPSPGVAPRPWTVVLVTPRARALMRDGGSPLPPPLQDVTTVAPGDLVDTLARGATLVTTPDDPDGDVWAALRVGHRPVVVTRGTSHEVGRLVDLDACLAMPPGLTPRSLVDGLTASPEPERRLAHLATGNVSTTALVPRWVHVIASALDA